MYSVIKSVRIASRGVPLRRSFSTAKKSKPFYRRIVNTTTVGIAAVGGLVWYAYANPIDKQSYLQSLNNPTPYELETLTPKQVLAHSVLMNRTCSRLLGKLMNINISERFREPLYSYVSKLIGIDTNEFEGEFVDYKTPNAFFTRNLKEGARPIIRCEDLLLSPVDGTVSIVDQHLARSQDIQLHQVKGVTYSLKEFLGKNMQLSNTDNNLYSLVIYLSPSNYHQIHSPADVAITDRVHVPGRLLPVKEFYATKVKGLFTLNERVVLSGKWKEGFFSIGLVGAYNVGSIHITNPIDDKLTTNNPHELIYSKNVHHKKFNEIWNARQGDRVGQFELGSTVVLAFESPEFTWLVQPGEKVKMGQPLGYIHSTANIDEITEVLYPEALRDAQQRMLQRATIVDVPSAEENSSVIEEMPSAEVAIEENSFVIEEMPSAEVEIEEAEEEMTVVDEITEETKIAESTDFDASGDTTDFTVFTKSIVEVFTVEPEPTVYDEESWSISSEEKDKESW